MKNSVDFLVIGAQKSGTTSLFKYMEDHPEIYMPPQKEINFFASANRFPLGVGWYVENFFAGADEERLWGEVCPAYLGYGAAPANIRVSCPDAKLVAILRNPIDRTYSHYRMAVRRGAESRTFRQAVEELDCSPARTPQTKERDDAAYLLEFSYYGKALERYLEHFDKSQILVLFQEDLSAHPEAVLEELFSFLRVDAGYRPPNLGREYHVSGEKRFFGLGDWLRRRKILKKTAKRILMSRGNLNAARFWFEQINVKPVRDEGPTPGERWLLRHLFEEDVASLERNLSIKTPWPEFGGSRHAAC